MDLGLEGKVAVVTGSGAGIGLAVCRALAAEGMRVVGASRRDPEEVVDGVEHHRLDLTEEGAVESLVDGAVDRHGSLALLVNNAGGGTIRDGFLSATDDDWVGLFALNLMVAVRATRAALPHLCVDGGAIVNISSINGVAPDPGIPDYSATKAALNSFGKSIATEYGNRGVRVVSVSPDRRAQRCGWARRGSRRWWRASGASRPRRSWPGPSERSRSAGWPSRPRSLLWSRSSGRRGRRTSAGSTCSSTAA